MDKREQVEAVFRYVDEHFDQMMDDVKKVCSFRSVASDKEGIAGASSYILEKMRQVGLNAERFEVEGGNPVLSGIGKGRGDKTLLFYNHYDVVTEGALERWVSPPYEPTIRDDRIWARGVSDNKGALFTRLHAIEAITAVCGELPINVKLINEGDEEAQSLSLKKFIRENTGKFKEITSADAIIWENSRNDEKNRPWASFGVGGSVGIELSVQPTKEDAHARMGAILPNAAWRLVWALASLKNEKEEILVDHFYDKVAPVTESDRKVLEEFPYEEEAIKGRYGIENFLLNKTGYELKKRIYTEPSLTVCGIDAGEVANGIRGVVPCKAKAKLSCRLMMNQRAEEIAQLIKEHLVKHGFDDIQVTITGCVSPVRTQTNIPLRHCLEEAAAMVYDSPLVVELAQVGSGPGVMFRDVWPDMPIVGIGPANTASAHHSPNENLYLEHYKKAVKMVIALLFTYA